MSFGYDVSVALESIRRDKEVYEDYLPQETLSAAKRMVQAVEGIYDDVKESIVELIKKELPLTYPHVSVWWYSVIIAIKKNADIFKEFVCYVRKNAEVFSVNTQYYLFYQLKELKFVFPELDRTDITIELWRFYQKIVKGFIGETHVSLDVIPKNKRNNDKVFVIIEQILSVNHGPTKTALDRCKVLMTELKKDVTLINTAEVLSQVGEIPFYGVKEGNYVEEGKAVREISWKGVKIPYIQCENNMPNIEILDLLLGQIRETAPGHIVAIGGNSMLANLVNRMIPVLTVGLCPSAFETTTTKYQLLGRGLNDADRSLLRQMNIPENRIIESIFTSSLKPQSEHISRKELDVPEGVFLMVVIGARLDSEVTPEFLKMLEGIIEDDMHIGFLGYFSNFEKCIKKYSKLRNHASYLGFTDDILSRLEICDLYINPKRTGGGTSGVEAMYKGVPVVTLDYGDVAVNTGKEFCVDNYKSMQKKIKEYYTNPTYYKEMSERAIKRAEVLLDSEREFVRIMTEWDKREEE